MFFSEFWVNTRDGRAGESKIPSCEPWILPFFAWDKHSERVEVTPMLIANGFSRSWWREIRVISLQPGVHIENIILLGPKQAAERLSLNHFFIITSLRRVDGLVEFISLFFSDFYGVINFRKRPAYAYIVRESQM